MATIRNKRPSYGTPRYAMKELCDALREYGKSQRAIKLRAVGDDSYESSSFRNAFAYGRAMGARKALLAVGAIDWAQGERVMARINRITAAKVTRRPFAPDVRRAA